MTQNEINAILDLIKYPGYALNVRTDSRGAMYLQAAYNEPDIVTGDNSLQLTRRWFISPEMVKSEIVQTAFKCILTSAEHRVREHFTYRGKRVYGPHFDVEALVEICQDKNLDYRREPK